MGFFSKKPTFLKTGIRIGVCSAAHGTGATTLSLALANYCCSKCAKETVYAEVNGTNEIAGLCSSRKKTVPFTYYGILVFSDVTFRQLPNIDRLCRDVQILDFGLLHPNNFREFLTCDVGFITGSVRPWQQKDYGLLLQRFFQDKSKLPANIRCLAALGIKEDRKTFAARYHFPTMEFPYLEDPFQLASADWQFLQKLLLHTGI